MTEPARTDDIIAAVAPAAAPSGEATADPRQVVTAAVDEAIAFDHSLTALRDALQQGDQGDSLYPCIRHGAGTS